MFIGTFCGLDYGVLAPKNCFGDNTKLYSYQGQSKLFIVFQRFLQFVDRVSKHIFLKAC